jgi:hypothetical protein
VLWIGLLEACDKKKTKRQSSHWHRKNKMTQFLLWLWKIFGTLYDTEFKFLLLLSHFMCFIIWHCHAKRSYRELSHNQTISKIGRVKVGLHSKEKVWKNFNYKLNVSFLLASDGNKGSVWP